MVSQMKSFIWSHTVCGKVRIGTSVYQTLMFSMLLSVLGQVPPSVFVTI